MRFMLQQDRLLLRSRRQPVPGHDSSVPRGYDSRPNPAGFLPALKDGASGRGSR